jgi:hypothetical protein
MDYLRRYEWPAIDKDFPPEFVQSEYCFKSTFRPWLRIEPTEEEERLLRKPARCSFANSDGTSATSWCTMIMAYRNYHRHVSADQN